MLSWKIRPADNTIRYSGWVSNVWLIHGNRHNQWQMLKHSQLGKNGRLINNPEGIIQHVLNQPCKFPYEIWISATKFLKQNCQVFDFLALRQESISQKFVTIPKSLQCEQYHEYLMSCARYKHHAKGKMICYFKRMENWPCEIKDITLAWHKAWWKVCFRPMINQKCPRLQKQCKSSPHIRSHPRAQS